MNRLVLIILWLLPLVGISQQGMWLGQHGGGLYEAPPVTANLKVHIQASAEIDTYTNGQSVSSPINWADPTVVYEQTISSFRPTFAPIVGVMNNQASYVFDGANDRFELTTGDFLPNNAHITVYVVGKADANVVDKRIFSFNGANSGGLIIRSDASTASFQEFLVRGQTQAFSKVSSSSINTARLYVVMIDDSGSQFKTVVSPGTSIAFNSLSESWGEFLVNGSCIGSSRDGASGFWDGYIAELLIYDDEHNNTEIASVRDWIYARYNF